MKLDLHRARTLQEVATRGSVAAAADALGYTQSAVSMQLSTLERDLGLTLIDRAQRPLRPTPAGAELLPEIEALLAHASAVGAAVDDLRELRRGRVELIAFASALASLVPPVVTAFRARHPAVAVGIAEGETADALRALRSGAADVALVHLMPGQELGDDAGLARAKVLDDPLLAVMPAGHRLAARERLTLAQVAREALVVPRAGGPAQPFRQLVEGLLPGELRIAYEVDDLAAAQAFAAAGLGVVLMHGLTLSAPPPGVAIRPLTGAAGARRIEAVRVARRRVPAAPALFEMLRAASTSPPGTPPGPTSRTRGRGRTA